MENDLLGLGNELSALGGFGILGHLIRRQADFLKGIGLDQNQIMRGGVRVAELNADRLVRFGGDISGGREFILAQVRLVHVLGSENHPFLDAGNLDL